MRKLPKNFDRYGMYYKLLKKAKDIAFYQLSTEENKRLIYGYDVVRITIKPATTIKGTDVPERESFPCDEEFGRRGWCFNQKENANRFFNTLVKKGTVEARQTKMVLNEVARKYM